MGTHAHIDTGELKPKCENLYGILKSGGDTMWTIPTICSLLPSQAIDFSGHNEILAVNIVL